MKRRKEVKLEKEIISHYHRQHETNISISFYMEKIKNLELDNTCCDLKPFKLDENRIIIIKRISDD